MNERVQEGARAHLEQQPSIHDMMMQSGLLEAVDSCLLLPASHDAPLRCYQLKLVSPAQFCFNEAISLVGSSLLHFF